MRDQSFTEVGEVRVDTKNRISLPKRARRASTTLYKAYANDAGQIVLDPQVVIPAAEAWLFSSKPAMKAVRKGLDEAREGKLVRRKSLAKHAEDELA